jgi:hypothetical protein
VSHTASSKPYSFEFISNLNSYDLQIIVFATEVKSEKYFISAEKPLNFAVFSLLKLHFKRRN